MSARLLFAATLGLSLSGWAQTAQDELERQLKEMVGRPPTKLLIEYESLDQPNYKLVEAIFELDGSVLPAPRLEKLNGEGKHLVFHGDVKPGKHALEVTVVLTDVAGVLFSYEAGFKWKVKKAISFDQQPGLEVQIVVIPELDSSQKDPKKKFTIKSTAVVKMLAKVEDGSMPDVPKPNLGSPKEELDAGTAVVAVDEPTAAEKAKILKAQQAEEARAKKQAAMEGAKRKKEETAAAKAAAIEEAKRKRAEAAAAKKTAAGDKLRQREEALSAKKAADDEKKRKREELAAVNKPQPEPIAANNPGGGTPAQTPPPTEPVAADAVADAGLAVAVAQPPRVPQQPKPAEVTGAQPESSDLPWPIIIGIGVALLGVIIFFATRRKSSPPS